MNIPERTSLKNSPKRPSPLRACGASLLYASFAVSIVVHSLILLVPAQGLKPDNESSVPGGALNAVIAADLSYRNAEPATADAGIHQQIMASETNTAAFEPKVENETKPSPPPDSPQPKASPSAKSGVALRPEFEQDFDAKYPFMALSKGIRGSVRASFRLGQDGAIEDIKIIDSAPAGVFDAAVVQALTRARIKPESVRKNGRLTVTVVFDPAGTNPSESFSQ